MKLVVATNNQGKVRELKRMLSPLGIEPVSLKDEGIAVEVVEDGETFAENAHIKAEAVYKLCRCPVLADDSGLEVDFLGGAPGIYSARYAGEGATDRERLERVLSELEGVDEGLRGARFVCALYCILDDETEYSVLGTLEGTIGTEPRGENGFGYDPIFYVGEKSLAQLGEEEKNRISHRANAMKKLVDILREKEGRIFE
ncbi:MAG: XTP/dITP diphosphatase [Bacteroides sp.]|nr:XTP/dITP diphosphatase [Eubacterium sp.]MCM1418572.1 XTP/dITP diphosphatase [Roseburia sp.]MCM1462627.1 XTP/dITP diphosphatase [Bacteroides sp.]